MAPLCLDQFQWSGNGVRAFYSLPGLTASGMSKNCPKKIEARYFGQSLLQFQFVSVLQQLPGQLLDEAQHPAFHVGRLIRTGAVRDPVWRSFAAMSNDSNSWLDSRLVQPLGLGLVWLPS